MSGCGRATRRSSAIAAAYGSTGREDAVIELLERQKKLTANQWKLICTANIADLLDFFDFFLIGYVTAALTKEWSLPYWQGGARYRWQPASWCSLRGRAP
jgi:hypothetical protein